MARCHKESTFETVLQAVLLKLRARTNDQIREDKTAKDLPPEQALAPAIPNAQTALQLLRHEAARHAGKSVVMIDAFDSIRALKERGTFADLLKQLSDQAIPIKFIESASQ